MRRPPDGPAGLAVLSSEMAPVVRARSVVPIQQEHFGSPASGVDGMAPLCCTGG